MNLFSQLPPSRSQNALGIVLIQARFFLISILTILCIHAAQAHNGAVGYAYPVHNIILDGDLGDWPSVVESYVISQVAVGVPVENQQDLTAKLLIGYHPENRVLYIGVEVTDQSMVVEGDNVNWDTHDGVELYLDFNHQDFPNATTQYALFGTQRRIFGHKRDWDGVDMKFKINGDKRTYEWAVEIGDEFDLTQSIAFDVVVIDMDEDKSFSWVAWGAHSQKLMSLSHCGDLMMLSPDTNLVNVAGNLDFSVLLSKPTAFPIRFKSQASEKSWVQTMSDSTGAYSILLPEGNYLIDLPEELMRIDEEFYRIAPNQANEFLVSEAENSKTPRLIPQQIAAPDFQPEQGILHTFDHSKHEVLHEYVATYREFYAIPGVSLAVIKDGKVAYYHTYGFKNAATQDPVTEETLFEAASITKPVFGFLVLRLAEKGTIDLDKPLYEYLPFEALEETPEYKKMTARHVLIHQSGLPNWGVPLINTPGTEYGYSGEGFEYLKRVVVHITGKDIEVLLDEEVKTPLDLYHMEFKDSEALRAVAAIGHLGGQPTYWGIPTEPGMAHSMHTEAKAFSRFAMALLEHKGLKPETYVEMAKIHTESPSEWWNDKNYREGAGLGVHVRESPFGNVIGHGGNNGDFKCLFEVYQELDMGYVVFTNSSVGEQLAYDLANFLIEGNGNLQAAEQ